MVLYVTLRNQDSSRLGRQLEIAAAFYIEGFRNIFRAMYSSQSSGASGLEFHFWALLLEILWASIFWFTILLVSGYLPWLHDFLKAHLREYLAMTFLLLY